MTVGEFAQLSGLTPSALRFYGDGGIVVPAETDAVSGYRYYTPTQVRDAIVVRHLREMGMALAEVRRVLASEPAVAEELIADHVRRAEDQLARTRNLAVRATTLLAGTASIVVAHDELIDAVRQVAVAVCADAEFPTIGGVHMEICDGALVLTATDRYLLSTRTLPSQVTTSASASATVDVNDLTDAIGERHVVTVAIGSEVAVDGKSCRVISGDFPDYRVVLAGLSEPVSRLVLTIASLRESMEGRDTITLDITDANGVPDRIHFRTDTLAPALASAIGPDVMLDISAPDRPVVVRSATDGDFTTLVMPTTAPRDDVMAEITAAVADGANGRERLTELWQQIGGHSDPLHRITLAHFLADRQDDPHDALTWDMRALAAADELTDERAQAYHQTLTVRGFLPSLHLNLADCYRRIGDFDSARAHLDSAADVADALHDDAYGDGVRAGMTNVRNAIADGSTDRLATN